MGYDISLHKLPNHFKSETVSYDDLFEIAYEEEYDDFYIRDTNFSSGNPKAMDFAEVFDIVLTNNDYFKIYTIEDYIKAKEQLQKMKLDNELLERINHFLKDINDSLNNGEIIFFCCG